MIPIKEAKVATLTTYFKTDIEKHFELIHLNLLMLRDTGLNSDEERYLDVLINLDEKIITGNLNDLSNAVSDLNSIFIIDPKDERQLEFKENILTCLNYSDRRTDFYPSYFRKLGIKACVYCNSQLCVTVDDEGKRAVAKFQVDHHIPKNFYPGLSVWLLNLYPACGCCNNVKGIKNVSFKLYSDALSPTKSAFRFEITDKAKTVAKYISTRNPNDIRISFREPKTILGTSRLNTVFAIEGIYETQIDIVEELILKSHIYDDSFKQELLDNFPRLFNNDKKELEKLILSSYVNETEIHMRPMSKFIQDISRQLDLID